MERTAERITMAVIVLLFIGFTASLVSYFKRQNRELNTNLATIESNNSYLKQTNDGLLAQIDKKNCELDSLTVLNIDYRREIERTKVSLALQKENYKRLYERYKFLTKNGYTIADIDSLVNITEILENCNEYADSLEYQTIIQGKLIANQGMIINGYKTNQEKFQQIIANDSIILKNKDAAIRTMKGKYESFWYKRFTLSVGVSAQYGFFGRRIDLGPSVQVGVRLY